MLEFLSHNCKEKASFFLIVFFNLLILCQKLLIQRYILPGGIFIFPLTFVINAVAGEVYGYSEPKKFIWLGFLSEIMFAGVTYAVTHMSYPSYFKESQAYNIVLDPAFRYAFSSLIGIFVGEFINIYILSKMKILMQGKNFLLRFLISNAIGQLFLSFIVDILIFFGKITVAQSLRAMEC
ncbi:queuosine precursor transporter [Piscirickettsia salmonis]|uniref:queuosine precursor transporter n=1 Tax=Piscirickettsia salmonis TaxID=1238 RepID=UPI0012B79FC3|nr:queuosine precursor transporter [Piscirickettsia salmonis]